MGHFVLMTSWNHQKLELYVIDLIIFLLPYFNWKTYFVLFSRREIWLYPKFLYWLFSFFFSATPWKYFSISMSSHWHAEVEKEYTLIRMIRTRAIYFSGKKLKEELNESEVFRLLSIFSNMLIVFNSSVNFIIYFAKDPK